MNIAIVDDSESDRQYVISMQAESVLRFTRFSRVNFFWQGFLTIPLTLSFSIFSWMRLPVWTRHTNY